jgi:hypothetical protein
LALKRRKPQPGFAWSKTLKGEPPEFEHAAVFQPSTEPFIVYTSNVFAILGASLDVRAGRGDETILLHSLWSVGRADVRRGKMVISDFFKIPAVAPLTVSGILSFSIVTSLWRTLRPRKSEADTNHFRPLPLSNSKAEDRAAYYRKRALPRPIRTRGRSLRDLDAQKNTSLFLQHRQQCGFIKQADSKRTSLLQLGPRVVADDRVVSLR